MTYWTEADERDLRRDARVSDRRARRRADHTPLGSEGMTAAEYYGWDDADADADAQGSDR